MNKYLNIALPKGRLGDCVYDMFERAGYGCPDVRDGGRKLIFQNDENNVRFFFVKPADVAVYVERGAADVGAAGKDTLLEYEPDVYELLDFGVGKCKMCVCGYPDFKQTGTTLKVATKFSNIARQYYSKRSIAIDIIHLNGSIELAPIVGLSDVIVDIVETGTTLRENGLAPLETVTELSARLIAGKTSSKFKYEEITRLTEKLSEIISMEVQECLR